MYIQHCRYQQDALLPILIFSDLIHISLSLNFEMQIYTFLLSAMPHIPDLRVPHFAILFQYKQLEKAFNLLTF